MYARITPCLFLCGLYRKRSSKRAGRFRDRDQGQVSDYYITVSPEHFLEGTITGPDGKPLEGATVMFTASPVHYTTDATGYYKIQASRYDHELFVYYPGMKYAYRTFGDNDTKIDIRMEADPRDVRVKLLSKLPAGSTLRPIILYLLQPDEFELLLPGESAGFGEEWLFPLYG